MPEYNLLSFSYRLDFRDNVSLANAIAEPIKQLNMTNYTKTTITNDARTEFHNSLSLTGAEISINTLPAGANVPFVHSHKQNEEIYGFYLAKVK